MTAVQIWIFGMQNEISLSLQITQLTIFVSVTKLELSSKIRIFEKPLSGHHEFYSSPILKELSDKTQYYSINK